MYCVATWGQQNLQYVGLLAQPVSLILTMIIVILAYQAITTQVKLHKEIYRPVVVCDFVIQYTALYFRVKNFGASRAMNIHIYVDVKGDKSGFAWEKLEAVRKGISCLSAGAELLYFLAGPGPKAYPKVEFTVEYSDAGNRIFKDIYEHDLSYVSKLDIGRERNSPIIKELTNIHKAVKSLKS